MTIIMMIIIIIIIIMWCSGSFNENTGLQFAQSCPEHWGIRETGLRFITTSKYNTTWMNNKCSYFKKHQLKYSNFRNKKNAFRQPIHNITIPAKQSSINPKFQSHLLRQDNLTEQHVFYKTVKSQLKTSCNCTQFLVCTVYYWPGLWGRNILPH